METYDLVVIGGGAAGEKGAVQAAYFGKRVALIEKEPRLGGAMVNTGTLPSKTLRETALYLSGLRQRGLFGVNLSLKRAVTVKDLLHRLEEVVAVEQRRMQENLARHRVTQLQGTARFVDPHVVEVASSSGTSQIQAEHVLIATGSSPNRPPMFPFDDRRVYDSDEMVRIDEIPATMSVVGGGVIGCEYACLFAALGVKVTIVETKPTVLGFLDHEVLRHLTAQMTRLGVSIRAPDQVTKCAVERGAVRLTLSSGEVVSTDVSLVCAGRQANTAALNLGAAGVTLGPRGLLEVDSRFRTTASHIAAVGDVIGFPALASTSQEQARVAVVHLFDLKYKTALAPVFPYGIFTIPEVSMAGETEESLKAKGIAYVRGHSSFDHNARGLIIGEEGFVKLLFRKEDMKLLGVHCIGEGATELVHIGLQALLTGAGADLFIETCFNYPTLAEAYKYATYHALGERSH